MKYALFILLSFASLTIQAQTLADTAEASLLMRRGDTLYKAGKYKDALPLYEQALAIRLKAHGPEHPDVATSYNNMGVVYLKQGADAQALEMHQKALAIRLKALGPEHPDVARSYNNMGNVYHDQGAYNQALEMFQKALAIQLKALGPEHPDVARFYNNMGNVYHDQGADAQALEMYQKALTIKLKALGPEHPDVASSYHNMGIVYSAQGAYAQALKMYQKSLAIYLKAFGPNHPYVANSYHNMGNVYGHQGAYAQSLEIYQKSLAIQLKAHGPEHPEVATSYLNMGLVYDAQGAYAQALEMYQKALAIFLKALGLEHPDVARSYNHMGVLYYAQGAYTQALEMYQKALAIRLKALGPEHPHVAYSYTGMGLVYDDQCAYAQALEMHQKSLAIQLKALGPEHPDLADTYNNMGNVYADQSAHAKGLEMHQKAIAALGTGCVAPKKGIAANPLAPMASLGPCALGDYLTRKSSLITRLYGLAAPEAYASMDLAVLITDSLKLRPLQPADLLETAKTSASVLEQACGLYLQTPQQASKAFAAMERGKGSALQLALAGASAIQQAGLPDSLRNQLSDLSGYVATLENQRVEEKEAKMIAYFDSTLFDQRTKLDSLNRKMEREYPKYYQLKYQTRRVELPHLQAQLRQHAPNAVVIEYLRSDSLLMAFAVRTDTFAYFRTVIDSTLEWNVLKLRRQLTSANPNLAVFNYTADTLYEVLLKPLAGLIAGRPLILAPDGILNFMPFEALCTSPTTLNTPWKDLPYLAKSHPSVQYTYSATLLTDTWDSPYQAPKGGLLALAPGFADKDTTRKDFEMLAMADLPQRSVHPEGGYLKPIPGTLEEVNSLRSLCQLQGTPHRILLNDAANEAVMQAGDLESYRYIHLATHGIVNTQSPSLSGIFLAPDTANNGFISAGETYNLPMNADLLVLSACETGLGRAAKGEGVIGLGRGLLYSGARSLILSQWSVFDASTSILMQQLYKNLFSGMPKAEALNKAKLYLLEKTNYAYPGFWAAFTLTGE
jgi:CHAT domain-containing protein/tetratricopeptide (TPR) repeat protein